MKNSQFRFLIILHTATLFLVTMLCYQIIKINSNSQKKSSHEFQANSGICKEESSKASKNIKVDVKKIDALQNFEIGNPKALNQLIVFSNATCSYCKKFYKEVYADLIKKYVKKDRLRIAFVYNGSEMNNMGSLIEKVIEIGKTKNQYQQLQKYFYENNVEYDTNKIIQPLLNIGFEKKALIQEINSQQMDTFIHKQLSIGKYYNIIGTPIFMINGHQLTGYKSKKEFIEFLKNHLHK